MDGELVKLVYAGEVLAGHEQGSVYATLADWMKLEGALRAALLAGGRVVIKRSLPAAQAPRWVQQFEQRGARLQVERLAAPAPMPAPAAPAAPLGELSLAPIAPVAPPPASWGSDPAAAPQMTKTIAPASDEMIECPACGERQSMRVLCRVCVCDMARGIAAKQEAAEAARAERQAEADARRAARLGSSAGSRRSAGSRLRSQVQTDDGDHAPLFSLSFEGRLGRMSYFAGGVLFLSGLCVLALLVALLPGFLSVIMLIVGLVVLLVWSVRLNVLRLHDINRSGWWVLVQSVPVVGVIASLVMMLLPGDAQANDYGDPVPERHAGLAIAALVVIALCVSYGWRQAKLAYERYADQAEAAEAQEAEDQSRTPRERIEALLGGRAATDAFYTLYARSPGHRAFASAGNGAWGMRAGANSSDEAALDALADCNGRLGQEVNTCQLVHLDDDWVVDPTR